MGNNLETENTNFILRWINKNGKFLIWNDPEMENYLEIEIKKKIILR